MINAVFLYQVVGVFMKVFFMKIIVENLKGKKWISSEFLFDVRERDDSFKLYFLKAICDKLLLRKLTCHLNITDYCNPLY